MPTFQGHSDLVFEIELLEFAAVKSSSSSSGVMAIEAGPANPENTTDEGVRTIHVRRKCTRTP